MADEILSQSEIDALLQMIGDDDTPQSGGGWQPGERESLERIGVLMAEAMNQAWPGNMGGIVSVSPPDADQATAEGGPVKDAPGIWVLAGLSGGANGLLAFWLGGQPYTAVVERMLGKGPADEPEPQEVERIGKAISSFFVPLAEGMSALVDGQVSIEPVEAQWAAAGDTGSILMGVPDFSGSLARLLFPCEIEGSRGELAVLWNLDQVRALIGAIEGNTAHAERGAAPPPVAPPQTVAETPRSEPAQEAEFTDFNRGGSHKTPHNIDLIMDVPLVMTVELGRTEKPIRDVLALGPGSIIELERLAGETVDVMVNGKLIAKGEVVVVDENFGVRITEIISKAERVRKLR